jgi:lauroyl/myristoyl acyltransferase
MMREQKFGRANLAAAFPEKSSAEIEAILAGVWDNLGRVELSEEVKPVRDAAGQIDIKGTMPAVTSVIEGWIREYPDQWLWLLRRWR